MRKPKILLLAVYNDFMMRQFEEIGICYIASVLRKNGYTVKVIGKHENFLDLTMITDYRPDIVGMSVYDTSLNSVGGVMEKIKKLLPETLICVGGCLPTYSSREMMEENHHIDYAVRGEGENVFLELVSALQTDTGLEHIKGLTFREGPEIVINEDQPLLGDLDSLPFPVRDMLSDNKMKTAIISTSRGCTANCTFCACKLFWKKWRGRSVGSIVNEIESIVEKYGVNTFNFIDGSFEDPGVKCGRVAEIAAEIVNRGLSIYYYANLRAEFHRKANDKLMNLLKQSGLCGACVGIESANEKDLKLYGKNATLEDNMKIIGFLRGYEINVDPGFINFNPYSTLEGLSENIEFLERFDIASSTECISSRYKMYKGTKLFDIIVSDDLHKKDIHCEDGFGYYFSNNRIMDLYEYVSSYILTVNRKANAALGAISFYTIKFLTFIECYKRLFSEMNSGLYETTVKAQSRNREIVHRMSVEMSLWFKRLIDLADQGWDPEKAGKISNEILSTSFVVEILNDLETNKNKLYLAIVKAGCGSQLISWN